MKTLLIIIAIILLSLGTADAQLNFGARAGYNLANVRLSASDLATENRSGFQAGFLAQLHLPMSIILQPELLFSQNGFQVNDGNPDSRFNLDYLKFPILVKYNVGLSIFQFQPYLGPEFGIAVNANRVNSFTDDIMSDINGWDFGVNFGADLVVLTNYFVGIRYQMGISDIFKSNPLASPASKDSATETNTNWMMSVGMFF